VFTNNRYRLLISNGSGWNGLGGARPCGGNAIHGLRSKIFGLHLGSTDPRALTMSRRMRSTVISSGIGRVQRHLDGGHGRGVEHVRVTRDRVENRDYRFWRLTPGSPRPAHCVLDTHTTLTITKHFRLFLSRDLVPVGE